MDTKLLNLLVCPVCKSNLHFNKSAQELICKPCRLAYAIQDDVPVMLEDEARKLNPDEELPA